MKPYIWTYWTKPQKKPENNIFYLSCLALSIEMARPFASSITVYTDTKGSKILKEFGITENINLMFDDIPDWVTPKMFAYPKMMALSKIDHPVIHLDHDAFVAQDFSSVCPQSDIVVEFFETLDTQDTHHPHSMAHYTRSYSRLAPSLGEDGISNLGLPVLDLATMKAGDILSFNCGFINSNTPSVTQGWASIALDGYNRLRDKPFFASDNIILEQASLYYLAISKKWNVGTLFDKDNLPSNNYYHLLGDKHMKYRQVAPFIFRKAEKANPAFAKKAWSLMDKPRVKTLLSGETFTKNKMGGIKFRNKATKAHFYNSIGYFLNFIYTDHIESKESFLGLRSALCDLLQDFQVCTEYGQLHVNNFSQALALRHSEIFNFVEKFLLENPIDIDALNLAAKSALTGELIASAENEPHSFKFTFNESTKNLGKKIVTKDLFDALDAISPDIDEDLPKEIKYLYEVSKSKDQKTQRFLSSFLERKNLQMDSSGTVTRVHVNKGPSVAQMAKNLGSAAVGFVKSGLLVPTQEQIDYRMKICEGCEFWEAGARFGLGKCLKCGCTSMKQKIASSVCPIGKWAALSKEEVESNYIPNADNSVSST